MIDDVKSSFRFFPVSTIALIVMVLILIWAIISVVKVVWQLLLIGVMLYVAFMIFNRLFRGPSK